MERSERAPVTTDALILRSAEYRDADRVLTLFTQHLGKVSALARGARASKRRFSGVLEPYAVIRVGLSATRSDMFTLERAELVRVFPQILTELDRMDVAGAALSVVRDAHEARVADEPLFLAMLQFLQVVDHEGDKDRKVLLAFVLRALALSGFAPRLDVCGRSGEAVPDAKPAYFDPVLGAVVGKKYGGGPFLLAAETRRRLLSAQRTDWLNEAREPWDKQQLAIARAALSGFVAAHVGEKTAERLFPVV